MPVAGREDLVERQRVLARFGEFVLRCDDLQEILNEGCRLIAGALGTGLAKVLEIERERDTALVLAGVGWGPGIVGSVRVKLGERSSEAYSIETTQPVVTTDIAREERFDFPDFMKAHGVTALVNVPIFVPGGDAFGVLQVDAREPRAFGDDDIEFLRTYAMIVGPVIDRLRTIRDLDHNTERFRLIVENARDYAIFLTDLDDIVTDWFLGAETVYGWKASEIIGKTASLLFVEDDQANGVPARETAEARTNGKAPNVRWHRRKDGSRVFIDGQTAALRGREGAVLGFMKVGQDTTERRLNEERQGILLAELQHRVRNVLAMVRSVVAKGGGSTVEGFRRDLEGRITAMARTQALLTRDAGVGADLEGLTREELQAHSVEDGRVTIAGSPLTLAPNAAEVITLAIHELTTNAVKHGALGRAGAKLEISWSAQAEQGTDWLRLVWQERGLPVARDAPRRVGFGTELITRRVPYELRGRGSVEPQPGGIRCTIEFPLVPGQSILGSESPAAYRNLGAGETGS